MFVIINPALSLVMAQLGKVMYPLQLHTAFTKNKNATTLTREGCYLWEEKIPNTMIMLLPLPKNGDVIVRIPLDLTNVWCEGCEN